MQDITVHKKLEEDLRKTATSWLPGWRTCSGRRKSFCAANGFPRWDRRSPR
jgi:hypothetical protein